jgi:hypothetical protein
MANPVFRVHPAIGIARVGNSEEFYLGPETMAGLPMDPSVDTGGRDLDGGLPIQAGTESTIISSAELRDSAGRMKRQAARFRIYHYPDQNGGKESYPCGQGEEIAIGSVVSGRTVADIVWTVHLANKKANSYMLNDMLGMQVYDKAHAGDLNLRNAAEGDDLNNATRLRRLVIDSGPRAVRGADADAVRFDKATIASYAADGARIETLPHYPKTFPDDSFSRMYTPTGSIDTLGELRTDEKGRLLVLPAWGRACCWLQPDGTPFPLVGGLIAPGEYGDVNADGWFDDTGDGPVSAKIVFEDGGVVDAAQAWAITTDPSYAPQTLNVVSLWDDIYDTWVRKLDLVPGLFDHRFNTSFAPLFEDHLKPIFRAPSLQRWNTNLPSRAIAAHDAVGAIAASDRPGDTIMTGLAYIRDPNAPDQTNIGAPFMPLSMGDAGLAFLTVSRTQYFFLQQWDQGRFEPDARLTYGPGEALDRTVLVNCLGGRFAPGIEATFVMRDPSIYQADWETSGGGPFRLRARPLDYSQVQASQPFLSVGYIPMHPGPDGIRPAPMEPGDVTKFMAVPWHTDYNACATHNSAPNPTNSTALYWSWPAQRPVQVHVASDVRDGKLGPQRYSVRSPGTASEDLGEAGRFQDLIDIVRYWHRIGFIVQGTAINGDEAYDRDVFLEVQGQLDAPEITPWPMNSLTPAS